MDLLFKRYASPYVLMDEMISGIRLLEFVDKVIDITNREKEESTTWELYLHRVFDKSYAEFVNDVEAESQEVPQEEFNPETTINKSKNILKGFNPRA